MTSSADAAAPEPAPGVTLEQYAGIATGLDDALPLEGLLANEGIDGARWAEAAPAWKARLGMDGVEGALFGAFRDKRREAEDWLGRRVAPIDDDLGAWLSFLQAWAAHPAPFEMLAGAGLRMNDVARLQRRWAARMAADADLQKKAADLAAKGAGPLPAIRAEPVQLKPFPWSKPRVQAPAPAPMPAPMPAALAPMPAAPSYLAGTALAPMPAAPSYLAGTALAPMPAAPSYLAGTALALNVPRGPALPFAEGAAPAPVTPPVAPPPEAARPRRDLGGTALAVDVPRGPALPFAAEPRPAPAPAAARAPSHLAGTAQLVDVPRGPALPFSAEPPSSLTDAPTPAPEPAPSPTPAAQGLSGGTSLAVDAPHGPAIPFRPPAGLKLPKSARPAPAPSAPRLTLEQHASLTVEVAADPERFVQTLSRYRLTPVQKLEADVYYRERCAADPALRDAWELACRTYREWLLQQPGRRG